MHLYAEIGHKTEPGIAMSGVSKILSPIVLFWTISYKLLNDLVQVLHLSLTRIFAVCNLF